MYNRLNNYKKTLLTLIILLTFATIFLLGYYYKTQATKKSEEIKKINLSLPQIEWNTYDTLSKKGVEKSEEEENN